MSNLVTPDFTDTQDTLGEGQYQFRIIDSEVGTWAGKEGKPDTQFIKWTLETFGEDDPKNNGRRFWDRTAVTGRGAFTFKNLYKAAVGHDFEGGDFDPSDIHGNEVGAVIAKDKNDYMNVKTYMKLG